jgi:hypothetical protein
MANKEWKKVVARKVSKMTPAQAQAKLDAISAETRKLGATIFHDTIKELTGGYNSQSINFYVIRKLHDQVRFAK